MNTDNSMTPGIQVEIGKIDHELKKLWELSSDTRARASLINFAVLGEGVDSIQKNTELLSTITKNHACRALVIGSDRTSKEESVTAWINAHCHRVGSGGKQVCSEQISFLLRGHPEQRIPNIVFSHLDSDLPLYFWWQGELPEEPPPQLWRWIDRLFFDSQSWKHPFAQCKSLKEAIHKVEARMTLCDLNWTRIIHWRLALAHLFDHPEIQQNSDQITRLELSHAPGAASTALLLAGCLAVQIGWTYQDGSASSGVLNFENAQSRTPIQITLKEQPGPSLNRVSLQIASAKIEIVHEPDSQFLYTSTSLPSGELLEAMLPAGSDDIISVVSTELNRAGQHQIYLQALNILTPAW